MWYYNVNHIFKERFLQNYLAVVADHPHPFREKKQIFHINSTRDMKSNNTL